MKHQTMHFAEGQLFTCFQGVPETELALDVPRKLGSLMQKICDNFNGTACDALFTQSITGLAEAQTFFLRLSAAGLLFHPEDDPSTILNSNLMPLFTKAQVNNVRLRILEVYQFMDDPCRFILDNEIY